MGLLGLSIGGMVLPEYTTAKVKPAHTYATAGDYVVVAEGKIKALNSYRIYDNGMYRTPTSKIKKIINIGKDMGVKNMYEAFYGQTLLSEIIPGALDGCTEVMNFQNAFSGCTNLVSIPFGLFNKCTKVTNFSYAFQDCSGLTSIPAGLFDSCTEVTTFYRTFWKCKNLQAIPEGLFKNNTKVTSFSHTFTECSNLKVIPTGLFDKCMEVTDFGGIFSFCTKVTSESPYTVININEEDVKVHLYERNNYPEYFTVVPISYSSCYRNCTGLTDYSSIPIGWK